MKKCILYLILFTIPFLSFSQINSEFAPVGSQWLQETQCIYNNGVITTSYDYHMIKYNTIINDTLFQRVCHEFKSVNALDYPYLDTACLVCSRWHIYTINNRVYMKDNLNTFNNKVLYDFNLNVGDTFVFYSTNYYGVDIYYSVPVTNVDTVVIGNIPRKRISFSTNTVNNQFFISPAIVWVEGIGDITYGFLIYNYHVQQLYSGDEFKCYRNYTGLIYGSCGYHNCITSVNGSFDEDLIINNPSTDKIILSLPELPDAAYSLYSIQGLIQRKGRISDSQTEINVTDLPRGMYVLKVITDKKTMTKKVVLQ